MIAGNELSPPGSKKRSSRMIIAAIILFSLLIIAWLSILSFTIGKPFLSPKIKVIIEPDWSRITSVDNMDLEKTAEILQERWKVLGYGFPWTTFRVNNNGKIIGLVPKKIYTKFIDNTMKLGIVEFVDVGSDYVFNKTLINTDAYNEFFKSTFGPIYHTILTNSEINDINIASVNQDEYVIDFTLTDAGKVVFANHTTNHISDYLAITVDKVVVLYSEIPEAINDGEVQISGKFSEAEAKNLKSILETSPLPIPLKWIVKESWLQP